MTTLRQSFLLIGFVAIALTIGTVPVSASKTPVSGNNLIIVGGEIGYPPYSFLDEKGEPTGFQVELTRAIARTMGMNVEIRITPWPETRKALENGTIDIIPGMFYSEERAKIYDFSPPFSIVSTAIFARVNSPSVKSIEDLRHKEIIVMRGEAMHDYILKHHLTDRIMLTETPADALRLLASGKGDYALVAQMPGFYWIKELNLSNIKSVGPSLEPFKNCFAVRKGNALLLSRFTEGLSIINQTGEYSKLYEKWLGVLEPAGIDLLLAIKYAAIVFVPLIILLALSFVWSWLLRNKVNQKTRALQESEERHRNIFENAHEAIFVAQDGNLVFLNSRTATQIGYSVEEIKSKSFIEFIHPDDHEMVIDNHIKRMKGEEIPNTYTFRFIHRDGSVRWGELNAVSINWDGKPATLNFMTDITEHKQAEEKLKKSQELEELILSSVPHGLFGVENREIFFANPAIKNVSGWEPEELVGKSSRIFFSNDQEWKEYGAMLYGMMENEAAISFEFPKPFIRKDGSEIYCRTSASRIGGDLTAGNRIVAMIEDITERKRSDEARQKSEEMFRLVFDASPVGIGIATLDGQVLAANAATIKMMGYTLEEIKTINVRDTYVRPDDRNLILKIVNETGAVSDYEVELKRKDGSSYWALLNMDKIRLYDKDIFLSTHRDITERKQAEKVLRENEEKYRLLFETAGEGILIAHEDKIKFTNPALEDILGYPSDIITTKPFSSFIHPDDRAMVVDHHVRRMRGEPMETGYRFRIIAADGNVHWLHIISRIISWEGIPASLSFVMDITDHKRAEDELRESEERYRNLFENSSEAIFVAQDGNLVFLNSRTATQLGYSVEELKSKSFIEFIHQGDQEMVVDNHIRRIKGEEIPNTYTFRFIHRDSSVRWGELNAISINWEGKPATLNFMTDITERKRMEEALKQSEFRYRTVTRLSSDFAYSCIHAGEEGYVLDWITDNFFTLSGFSEKEAYDQRCWIPWAHPDDLEAATEPLRLLKPGESDTREFRFVTKEGRVLVFLNHMECESDTQSPTGMRIFGAVRDITSRKQAEKEKRDLQERLNRAEKMEALGTLAGGVAHDLNNVLGVVVGYAELTLDSVDKTSPLRHGLENIMNGGQKAAAIVDDLLTLARRGVPVSSILNLNTIIADFQKSPELNNLSFHHPDVKIKTDLDPDMLNISGSSVHLGKSLYNLISNAHEAMTKGGTLTIKTTNQYLDKPMSGYNEIREGDYVVLTISDTGEGISEKDLKRIFEPFYTKKIMGRSGTGLGLAVVWGTVTDHNGYINVHSEEGKGSTFTLYFPVTREEIPDEALAIDVSAYMGNGQSILIVDDVSIQRELATDMLKKLNYNVDSAKSGEEAIIYLKDHQPDLIVLDMIMDPGMDGLDTYKSIIKINPKQKTIIVSGFSESDRVKEAKRLGAGAYVRKPYIKEKLGMAVKKELDRK